MNFILMSSFSIIVIYVSHGKYFLAIASFCTSPPPVAPSVSPPHSAVTPAEGKLCGKDAAALFYCFPLKNEPFML